MWISSFIIMFICAYPIHTMFKLFLNSKLYKCYFKKNFFLKFLFKILESYYLAVWEFNTNIQKFSRVTRNRISDKSCYNFKLIHILVQANMRSFTWTISVPLWIYFTISKYFWVMFFSKAFKIMWIYFTKDLDFKAFISRKYLEVA